MVIGILRRAIEKFGFEHQLRKTQEECAELIVAINHYMEHPGKDTLGEVYDELADVEIMLKQMAMMFT